MINYIATCLVAIGIGLLISSLVPIGQLINQIPHGSVRRRWHIMALLVIGFIVGYTSYGIFFWNVSSDSFSLIVPSIFFFGAIFVWLTARLALQTAIDVRRVVLLEQENIMDPLIGIYNRRYLDRRLDEEFARARRYHSPLSILMLDIDHFKKINDAYGHPVGDQVLNYLGKLVLHILRESDVVARYGGEEFVIITPYTVTTTATNLAERLRQHIENHELVLTSEANRRQSIRITVSIGVAQLTESIADSHELLKNADETLYKAKQSGRNCVRVFEPNTVASIVTAE